jgi:hypothetical protein
MIMICCLQIKALFPDELRVNFDRAVSFSFPPSMPLHPLILKCLPDLPPSTGHPWSAEVVQAHRELHAGFRASRAALNLDESDPIRLGHHLHQARAIMVPVVEALRRQRSNPLPPTYIEEISEAILALVGGLQSALAESTVTCVALFAIRCYNLILKLSSERSKVSEVEVVRTEKSGRRGRPRKIISNTFLQEAFRSGRNISISRVATSLGVHRNSVKHYMKLYKIVRQPFSTISDPYLDSMIKQFKDSHPNAGIRYIRGFLLQQGIRIQRSQITSSLSRVDNVAKVVLRNKTIKRREYKSAQPNALWHMDGHHKLGPWGVVIHGITDRFDQVVCLVFNPY